MALAEVREANQVSVILNDVPGELARASEALAKFDVNIEGLCQTTGGNMVLVRFIVDKVDEAQEAFESLKKTVLFQRVIAMRFNEDMPGIMGKVTRAFGDAGINIVDIYHASSGRGGITTMFIAVPPEYFSRALRVAELSLILDSYHSLPD
jgi:hypothetical protein